MIYDSLKASDSLYPFSVIHYVVHNFVITTFILLYQHTWYSVVLEGKAYHW